MRLGAVQSPPAPPGLWQSLLQFAHFPVTRDDSGPGQLAGASKTTAAIPGVSWLAFIALS